MDLHVHGYRCLIVGHAMTKTRKEEKERKEQKLTQCRLQMLITGSKGNIK